MKAPPFRGEEWFSATLIVAPSSRKGEREDWFSPVSARVSGVSMKKPTKYIATAKNHVFVLIRDASSGDEEE